jgi:uncharacterized membrane protein
MPNIESGFKRAITEVITGIITIAIIEVILDIYKVGWLIILINIISIILIIFLIDKITYWSIVYLLGWLFGLAMLSSLLAPWEIVLYFIIGVPLLIIKFKNKLERIRFLTIL